jgi:hypothetical protein
MLHIVHGKDFSLLVPDDRKDPNSNAFFSINWREWAMSKENNGIFWNAMLCGSCKNR